MQKIFSVILLLGAFTTYGQSKLEKKAAEIEAEGKRLYRSEMASWYGTDLFMEQYADKENIGAYFSYTEGDSSKCVFYSRGDDAQVIGTITFDTSYNTHTASLSLVPRPFTAKEKTLYTLRKGAEALIQKDTFFKHYQNTNLNLIPILSNGEKKVYILTGTSQNNVIIFGNDYLIRFDQDDIVIGRERLHHNILATPYGQGQGEYSTQKVVGAIHNHLPPTGEFITPTDICTLMLYQKLTGWTNYTVVSKDYMSLWDCSNSRLIIMTTKAIDRINEDQKKRHPKE